MKKLAVFSFFLVSFFGNTQGNLQFNKVLTLGPGDTYTVPQGKVLKIESINFSITTLCIPKTREVTKTCYLGNRYGDVYYGVYTGVDFLTIANQKFRSPDFDGNSTSLCDAVYNEACKLYDFGSLKFNLPIWLDSGKNVQVHSGVTSILISAIEFNIVP